MQAHLPSISITAPAKSDCLEHWTALALGELPSQTRHFGIAGTE
ncbi:MAG: hypothetical protein N2035_09820 [Chthoniobacterales bacterium]|nr:hypothetical protein [Chthoniobacterales bacterium]